MELAGKETAGRIDGAEDSPDDGCPKGFPGFDG